MQVFHLQPWGQKEEEFDPQLGSGNHNRRENPASAHPLVQRVTRRLGLVWKLFSEKAMSRDSKPGVPILLCALWSIACEGVLEGGYANDMGEGSDAGVEVDSTPSVDAPP